MCKMLNAGFSRLWRNRIFLLMMALMLLAGILIPLDAYHVEVQVAGNDCAGDSALFNFVPLMAFALAIFCSLFIGTEYADGTLRNKLIVGNRRGEVYLANLTVSIAAGALMCAAYLVGYFCVAIPLLGNFKAGAAELAAYLLTSAMLICAVASLMTLECMLNRNRALSIVICLVGLMALLLVSSSIQGRLEEPEMVSDLIMIVADQPPVISDPKPNPLYLTGTIRKVFSFLAEFLPTGQLIQIANREAAHLLRMSLYSLLIAAASTLAGLGLFRKKNIQ